MNLRNTSVEDKLSFPDLKRLVFVVYQEKIFKSYHYVCIFSATHEKEDLPCPFFFSFFQYLTTLIPYEKRGGPPSIEDLQVLTNSEFHRPLTG